MEIHRTQLHKVLATGAGECPTLSRFLDYRPPGILSATVSVTVIHTLLRPTAVLQKMQSVRQGLDYSIPSVCLTGSGTLNTTEKLLSM